MPRNVGDRYVCEKCGAVLVYEKACPCPERDDHAHAEICCGQQMKLAGKSEPTKQQA
jgi:hypothetical protein